MFLFLAGHACFEVTGMLFTMQTKFQSCKMDEFSKMYISVVVLIQVQFRSRITLIPVVTLCSHCPLVAVS